MLSVSSQVCVWTIAATEYFDIIYITCYKL